MNKQTKEALKEKIRQTLRENYTTKPLGNRQPWRDIYDLIEPVLEAIEEA